jgi:uncharacterized membrane protein
MDGAFGFLLLVAGAIIFVTIVLPVVAMAKVSSMSGRLEALQTEVEALRSSLRRLQSPENATQKPAAQARPEAEPERARQVILRSITEIPATESEPPQPKPAAPTPAPIPSPASPAPPPPPPVQTWRAPEHERAPKPARSAQDWEMLIGGNFFNRIGAVAILIGVALLFSYAYGHHYITPRWLFCIGLISGSALTLGGMYFHKHAARIFAQGLFGAGLSVLYVTIYAGFNIYSLIGTTLAFGMMSAVTAVAILLALNFDSVAISLLGLIGGFLTPVILKSHAATGGAGAGALFIYLALLDLGLLAVAIRKESWVILEPLTLAGTYLVYWAWHASTYTPSLLPTVIPFLATAWLLFLAVDICRITKQASTYLDLRAGVSTLSVLLFYTTMYTIVNPPHHRWMGLITLVIGLVYLLTALVAFRQREGRDTSGPRYVVTAIALLAIATVVQYRGFTLASLWAVEAAALAWCAMRWKLQAVYVSAFTLLAASAVALVTTDGAFAVDPARAFQVIVNQRFLTYAIVAAGVAITGAIFRQSDSEFAEWANALDYAWIAILFTILTIETNDYFRRAIFLSPKSALSADEVREMVFALVWGIYSLPLVWCGIKRTHQPFLICGMICFVTAAVTCATAAPAYATVPGFHSFANLRVLTFITMMLIATAHRISAKQRQSQFDWINGLTQFLDISVVFLGFELLTLEIQSYFHVLPHTDLLCYVTLAIAYAAYSILVSLYAMFRRSNVLIGCALTVSSIAGLTIAFGGSTEGAGRVMAPLLSVRSLGFVTVIAGLLFQRLLLRSRADGSGETVTWLPGILQILEISAIVIGFELLTLEMCYFFRPAILSGSGHAELVRNVALAVSYAAYAVVTTLYALRRRSNAVIGCALLISAVAILTVTIGGSATDATNAVVPLVTVRSLGFIAVVAALLLQQALMRRRIHRFTWAKPLLNAIPIIVSLLIFQLLTLETWSYFSHANRTGSAMTHAADLRQMALSVVWLVYSILLLAYGFWRRMASLRYVAIGIFEFSILKVFLYDLSFLETLYRIFSFIALGIILMATSYLYHRFKGLIVSVPESAQNESEDVQPES